MKAMNALNENKENSRQRDVKSNMKETKKMVRMVLDGDEKKLCCVTADNELLVKVDISKITLDQAFELFDLKDALEFPAKKQESVADLAK